MDGLAYYAIFMFFVYLSFIMGTKYMFPDDRNVRIDVYIFLTLWFAVIFALAGILIGDTTQQALCFAIFVPAMLGLGVFIEYKASSVK